MEDEQKELLHEVETSAGSSEKEYEISYIVRTENGQKLMEGICSRHGGTIVQSLEARKMALSYPIQKQTSGFFGVLYVMLDSQAIREIEKEAKLEQEVLRILVVAEPIKIRPERQSAYGRPYDGPREGGPSGEGEEISSGSSASVSPRSEQSGKAVTNEELEKKLEEILG